MSNVWKRGTGLGDVRLDARAAVVLDRIVAEHSLVLKRIGNGRAGTLAAGRLLASEKVSPEHLLAAEVTRTQAAIRGRRIVAAQDTTEINFAGRDKRRRGLGPAGDGVSKGFFIHPVIAIDADDEAVLGVLHAHIWTRRDEPLAHRHRRPFAERESARWLEGCQAAAEHGADAASMVVVGDRESDIFQVLSQTPAGCDIIVRARHDRPLSGGGTAFSALAACEIAGSARVKVASKGIGDKGRTARVAIRFLHADAANPQRSRSKSNDAMSPGSVVRLGFVDVCEIDTPEGVEPLHWRLAATLPVTSLEEACEIIRLYRLRWRIEEVFRALKKDGLRLEETQVQEARTVMNLAALGLAAAVRIIQLVDARDGSARPATDVIDAVDIDDVERISRSLEGGTERQKNKWTKGGLPWLAWVVARLGGWDCYYGKPGPKTMAHGWDRLSNRLEGMRLAAAGSLV